MLFVREGRELRFALGPITALVPATGISQWAEYLPTNPDAAKYCRRGAIQVDWHQCFANQSACRIGLFKSCWVALALN
jgi:hypothetical protein